MLFCCLLNVLLMFLYFSLFTGLLMLDVELFNQWSINQIELVSTFCNTFLKQFSFFPRFFFIDFSSTPSNVIKDKSCDVNIISSITNVFLKSIMRNVMSDSHLTTLTAMPGTPVSCWSLNPAHSPQTNWIYRFYQIHHSADTLFFIIKLHTLISILVFR